MKKVTGALAAFLYSTSALWGATLLPNGQQQFIDANGKPYANGKVYFYSNYPTCSVLKNTYQDTNGSVLNTNPVVLDAAGRATIFGVGAYCQVLKDQLNNTIWTKFTADTSSTAGMSWAGTSVGTGNAQSITSSSFSSVDGQTIYFIAGTTNTGPATLTVSGTTAAIVKPVSSGASFLTGGEIVAGNVVGVTYVQSTGQFQLITNDIQQFGTLSNLAAATTTNLNSIPSNTINVTGSGVSITSFGVGGSAASVNSLYFVKFAAANTIVYNATSMITPTAQNITVSAGDMLIVSYLGGSNWQVLGNVSTGGISTNAQTGTTYTLDAADRNKLVTFSNAATVTVTLPSAASGAFIAGYSALLQNIGTASNVALTPASGTINGQSSLTLAPGQGLRVVSDGTNWQIAGVGSQLVLTTQQATTSGTVKDFTGIPAWARRITVMFDSVSLSGTTDFLIQIGSSATPDSSGYVSASATNATGATTSASSTAGYLVRSTNSAYAWSGAIILTNLTGNVWVAEGSVSNTVSAPIVTSSGGTKTLSGTLVMVRLASTGGDSLDAGQVSITYE